MLPEVSMARTSSTSTSCGPVADGNVGGNAGIGAGAAAKPTSGPRNASKALAAIALNDALTFRRMIRPASAVAFAAETYTEPEPAANGRSVILRASIWLRKDASRAKLTGKMGRKPCWPSRAPERDAIPIAAVVGAGGV